MTGKVRVKLHRGQAIVDGTTSPYGLYDEKLATYGVGDKFNHDAASGFIELWGLPLELGARVAREALTPVRCLVDALCVDDRVAIEVQAARRFATAVDATLIRIDHDGKRCAVTLIHIELQEQRGPTFGIRENLDDDIWADTQIFRALFRG